MAAEPRRVGTMATSDLYTANSGLSLNRLRAPEWDEERLEGNRKHNR